MTIQRRTKTMVCVLGLLWFPLAACNRWQSSTVGVEEPGEVQIPETDEDGPGGAADETASSASDPDSADPDPRESLRPYYEWTDSEAAADALGRMGPAAVPKLVEALQDPNPQVRMLAARVLARIGPNAVIAVPTLQHLLEDPDGEVRRAATRALGQIGPAAAAAIPDLIRLLEEPDPPGTTTDVTDPASH